MKTHAFLFQRTKCLCEFVFYGFLVLMLAACGGGGGGGGGSSTTASNTTPSSPFPRQAPVAPVLNTPDPPGFVAQRSGFENFPAYATQDNHLSLIKASAAYARGATGRGETVVVVDSGIDASHVEFQGGKVRVVTGIGNSCSPSGAANGMCSDSRHGTAVASLAAGHRGSSSSGQDMHGVAFDASITFIPIELRGDSPSLPPLRELNAYSWTPQNREIFDNSEDYRAYIAEGAILNFSFGFPFALSEWRRLGSNCGSIGETGPYACFRYYYRPTVEALAQAGTDPADRSIVVTAAGNYNGVNYDRVRNGDERGPRIDASSPSADAAFGAIFNRPGDPNLDHLITAVAVGADGEIASYSNRCGMAKHFCIAAPGGDSEDGGIFSAQAGGGYSRHVGTSYAAPLVSGSLAVLRQYFRRQLGNHELVDRLLATANRRGIYTDDDIYGHGLLDLDAATRPVGVMMTSLPGDPNSRPFAGSGIELSGGAFGNALADQLAGVEIAAFDSLGAPFFQPAAALVRAPVKAHGGDAQEVAVEDMPLSARWRAPKLSVRMDGAGGITGARLGLANGWWFAHNYAGDSGGVSRADISAPPYLSLVRNGPGLGWSRPVGGGFGFTLLHGAPRFDGEAHSGGGKHGFGALFDYRLHQPAGRSGTGLWLQAGAVHEADGLLGARAQNAFGAVRGATAFAGVNGMWTPGAGKGNWRLMASAHMGRTRAHIGGGGFLRAADDVMSSAFSFAAARNSLWQRGDRLSLRLSQPLRVEGGEISLRVPAGRTRYGEGRIQPRSATVAASQTFGNAAA